MNLLAPVGSILGSLAGLTLRTVANAGLDAVSGWVVAGAEATLHEVVALVGLVTTPSLAASWFSGTYWKVAALSMLLCVPFLFAAAVQAVLRTDLAILIRAGLVDLPIAAVAVTISAPIVTLLLAATDELCSLVTGGGPAGGDFFAVTATDLTRSHSGFLLVVIAVLILLSGLFLLLELIIRAAAIYVVVLFLPLGFAAMVWPARRVWVKRMVEVLLALILSKFVIVAILAVAVAGLATFGADPSALSAGLTAMALLILATLSPFALLRLLPFAEVAAEATGALRQETMSRARQLAPGRGDGGGAAGAARDLVAGAVMDPVRELLEGMSRSGGSGASAGRADGGGESGESGSRVAMDAPWDATSTAPAEGVGSLGPTAMVSGTEHDGAAISGGGAARGIPTHTRGSADWDEPIGPEPPPIDVSDTTGAPGAAFEAWRARNRLRGDT